MGKGSLEGDTRLSGTLSLCSSQPGGAGPPACPPRAHLTPSSSLPIGALPHIRGAAGSLGQQEGQGDPTYNYPEGILSGCSVPQAVC